MLHGTTFCHVWNKNIYVAGACAPDRFQTELNVFASFQTTDSCIPKYRFNLVNHICDQKLFDIPLLSHPKRQCHVRNQIRKTFITIPNLAV